MCVIIGIVILCAVRTIDSIPEGAPRKRQGPTKVQGPTCSVAYRICEARRSVSRCRPVGSLGRCIDQEQPIFETEHAISVSRTDVLTPFLELLV